MADTVTVIVVGGFALGVIGLLILLTIYTLWVYLENKKDEKKEDEVKIENQERNRNTVPQHIRNRNFSDFIKELIRKGELIDTDRGYRRLRKQLMNEVDEELNKYRRKKMDEDHPDILKELEKCEKNDRRNQ